MYLSIMASLTKEALLDRLKLSKRSGSTGQECLALAVHTLFLCAGFVTQPACNIRGGSLVLDADFDETLGLPNDWNIQHAESSGLGYSNTYVHPESPSRFVVSLFFQHDQGLLSVLETTENEKARKPFVCGLRVTNYVSCDEESLNLRYPGGKRSEWLGVYKDLDTLVANVREHVIESVLGSMAKRDKPLRVRFAWPGMGRYLPEVSTESAMFVVGLTVIVAVSALAVSYVRQRVNVKTA